jgi:hypothetical protein
LASSHRPGSPSAASRPEPELDALLLLLLILVALAVGAAVAAPFLRPERGEAGIARRERLAELEARKEAKYREIRDAELDYRTGKLSSEDHRALDRGLRREAIAILEEIDRAMEGEGDGEERAREDR